MSIQNKRIKLLTNNILKDNLREGLLPDSREFIWQLNSGLNNLNNDKSSYKFKPYRNTEILKSSKLNTDHEMIKNDLSILYENNKHLHNVLNREYQYFLIKKKKLEKELDIEENRLKEYIQNNQRAGFLPYAYDTFDTTEKVDLDKTEKMFINTKNNATHIVEEKNNSKRIFPNTNIQFGLKPDNLDLRSIDVEGKIEDILSDKEDKVWQKQIMLKENIKTEGVLTFEFDKKQLINNIEFSVFTIKPVMLSIQFSPDENTWYNLPYHEEPIEVEKEISIDFPEMEIKRLKIIIEKSEHDDYAPSKENYDYHYLFGFESIAFHNKSYPTKGVLYTNKLALQNKPENYVVDTVQLYTDDWAPTGTEINYEVALPSEELDWQPIDPMNIKHPKNPQKVYFHSLRRNNKNEMFFPEDLSVRQSEAEDLIKNGIPLYKLSYMFGDITQFHLPKLSLLENSLKLFVGKNTAEVISFRADNKPLQVSDFLQIEDSKQHYYQNLSKLDSGDLFINKTDTEHKKYLIRIGLYLDQPRNFTATPVSTDEIIINLNGQELFSGLPNNSHEVHYTFKSGWNEIVVLVNGINATKVNGISTSLGFNFYTLTNSIYSSSKPLNEVSTFELQNNVKLHDRTVFAKRETDNGIEILTNFAQKGLRFDLFFDYKEEFTEEDGILMRAIFRRDNGDNVPSPILRKYRLELS